MQTVEWTPEGWRTLLGIGMQATVCNICLCPATLSEAELCHGLVYLVEKILRQYNIQIVSWLQLTTFPYLHRSRQNIKNMCSFWREVWAVETGWSSLNKAMLLKRLVLLKDVSYNLEPLRQMA